MQRYVEWAIANLHFQCIQDPYCRRLRPQHVGLKLRFSSLVSVGRLLAMLGRPARRGGGDWGRRLAAGWPQMSAKWSKCVQTTITKNIVDEGKKLERKTRYKMTTKEAFPTRNIYIFFFLYFLWDNKYNQLDNSWIFGIFALFTFITFRAKQSCI